MDIQTAKQIFDAHNGIMKSKEIIENKIYNQSLKRLRDEGYVVKIKFGYYQWQDERVFSETTIITRLFPDVV